MDCLLDEVVVIKLTGEIKTLPSPANINGELKTCEFMVAGISHNMGADTAGHGCTVSSAGGSSIAYQGLIG
ncbi:MAG TPA: hypothetical protein VNV88_11165 [Candidatus Solibacter sp.]|nr:hypothetical protein [Candidatus Solibacter sp.]